MQTLLVREDVASCVGVSTLHHHHTRDVRDEAMGIENATEDGVCGSRLDYSASRLRKAEGDGEGQDGDKHFPVDHKPPSGQQIWDIEKIFPFKWAQAYSTLPPLSICADVEFFENYLPKQHGLHRVNVWSTYELQHGWLKGVGLGFGARHDTRQSGDLLDTFSNVAYDPIDIAIFCRWGHLGWKVNAFNLGDQSYFTGSCDDLCVHPGSPRSIQTTICWTF